MAININKTGKNLNINQNIKDSEIDSEMMDVNAEEVGEDANVTQNIEGSKVKSKLYWAIIAIGGILTAIAGYHFTRGDVPAPTEMNPEIVLDTIEADTITLD